MMKLFKKSVKYNAQGFVEALVAILVAGIATISIMNVAAITISQVIKNDKADELTQYAIEGSEMASRIAEKNAESEDEIFPDIAVVSNLNACYFLEGSLDEPQFAKDGANFRKCNFNGTTSACPKDPNVDSNGDGTINSDGDNVYRLFCMTNRVDVDSELLVGKVFTGFTLCDEGDTGVCDVSEYSYTTILKVQK